MSAELENTEKCGIFVAFRRGVSPGDVAKAVYDLKNRGKDSFGVLAITEDDDSDAVEHFFGIEELESQIETFLENYPHALLYLCQNRYVTSGDKSLENAQPFIASCGVHRLSLAHNGNLPNQIVDHLRGFLHSKLPDNASDSRIMTQLLIERRQRYASWKETFLEILPHFQGAFSLACVTDEDCIYAFRDPWGFRPLCIGKKNGSWIVASESNAFSRIDAEYIRELEPGEMVRLFSDGTSESTLYAQVNKHQFCTLEHLYFANIDTVHDETTYEQDRLSLGRAAGERFIAKNIPIDITIPILNSGKRMWMGATEVLQTVYPEMESIEAIQLAIQTRAFLAGTKAERKKAVHEKHVPDSRFITGRRIALVDDSMVRGDSMEGVLEKVKECSPKEIHLIFASEPIVDICEWGINLSTQEELFFHRLALEKPDWKKRKLYFAWLAEVEERAAAHLGVDSVTFLDRGSVNRALHKHDNQLCRHCFGGDEPITDQQPPAYLTHLTMSATLLRS